MKILVTGGAGFIGSHLCDLLVCNDNQVVALDICHVVEKKILCIL